MELMAAIFSHCWAIQPQHGLMWWINTHGIDCYQALFCGVFKKLHKEAESTPFIRLH